MSSGQRFVRESHKAGLVVVNLGLNAKPSGSGEPEVSSQKWLVAVSPERARLLLALVRDEDEDAAALFDSIRGKRSTSEPKAAPKVLAEAWAMARADGTVVCKAGMGPLLFEAAADATILPAGRVVRVQVVEVPS